MSGSLFAPWARVRDPREYALQLAGAFNCTEASEGEDGEKKNPSAARRRDPIEHCLRYRVRSCNEIQDDPSVHLTSRSR